MNSLPQAFVKRIQQQLPNGYEDFLFALQQAAPTSIRINPKKGMERMEQRIPWTDYGYYLTSRPKFTLDPLLHAGSYYVQEASSMFLEQAINKLSILPRP
jgi:hypothetical protein